jgi:hypothetical protein
LKLSRPTTKAAVLVALAALAAVPAAQAGPPGKWTQVTGVGEPDPNILDAGLARTGDGVLHVLWSRESTAAAVLLHSTISANAKTVGGPDTVFTNTNGGINESAALVRTPDGLRAFFGATNQFTDALGTATAGPDGKTWSAAATASLGGTGAKPVYVAAGIAAALAPNGTFVSAWGSSAPGGEGFHAGLSPTDPDGSLGGGTVIDPGVGVDSQSSAAFVAGNLLDEDGTMVLPVSPAGARVTIPNSGAEQLQHPVGITGRIGKPGVFVAYTQGTNEFLGKPAIYRVDTGKSIRLSNRKGGEDVCVAAAPGGRLWAFWKDGDTIFATRSNTSATKFGRVVSLRALKKGTTIYELNGEGSLGPLDVLALLDPPSADIANWHQRILPGLSLSAKKGKNGKVTFVVSDAGTALGGAKVKLKGDGSKTTGGKGTAKFTLSPGHYTVTASKSGYAADSLKLRIK